MSALYDCVGLAFDAFVTSYLIKLYRKESETINNIQDAPLVGIGPDLNALLDAYPNQTLPYAVIRGRVREVEDALESSTGVKGVMQITTLHEVTSKRFGDSWDMGNLRPLHETRNVVPFGLKAIPESDKAVTDNILVRVENPFDGLWESLLLPTSSAFTPSNSILDTASLGSLGNGKILGVRKTERFLPVGTIITGIGQISRDAQGSLKLCECSDGDNLSHPYVLTTLPIEDLVRRLETRRLLHQIMIGMTVSIGLVLVSRRLYAWWRKHKMRKLRESILAERRNVKLDDLCRCQTCLVCLLNPREVILLGCGHVCVCADCVMKVNGMCPICRERISSTHRAYIA